MKNARIIVSTIVIVFVLLATSAGHAFAMTPEQQAMYDAWYQARFGVSPSHAVPVEPAPSQPSPSQPAQQPPKTAGGSIQPVQPNAFEQGVLDLLNQQRAKSGLAPVKLDPYVSAVARFKV